MEGCVAWVALCKMLCAAPVGVPCERRGVSDGVDDSSSMDSSGGCCVSEGIMEWWGGEERRRLV